MFRTISLAIACLLLTSSGSVAQEPLRNKIAQDAQRSYQEAIAKAKKEYAAKLELAITDAGDKGDIGEATRLAAEKKKLDSDDGGANANAFEILRKNVEGTTWSLGGGKVVLRFGKDGNAVDSNGAKLAWSTDGKHSLVLQSHESTRVYIWQLDKNLSTAKRTAFTISKHAYKPARRIRP